MERFFGYSRLLATGAPAPSATVTVYRAGTLTLATIYDDDLTVPTPKANPFTAASDGFFFYYAQPGRYDVRFSAGGIPTPYTWGDVQLGSPFGYNVKEFGAVGDGSTNDTTAIQNAITAAKTAGAGTVYLPRGTYRVVGNIAVDNITLVGELATSGDETPQATHGTILTQALADAANPMFLAGFAAGFQGLNFYYPDQDGADPSPRVFAPTIRARSGATLTDLRVHQCKFFNAYRCIDLATAPDAKGRLDITDVQAYAVLSFLEIRNAQDSIHLHNVIVSHGIFRAASAGAALLRKFTQTSGIAIDIDGQCDGLQVVQSLIFGYDKAIRLRNTAAGANGLNISTFHSTIFDVVRRVLDVQANARIEYVTFTDCKFNVQDPDTASEVCDGFLFAGTGAGLSSGRVSILGCEGTVCTGRWIRATQTVLNSLIVSGCRWHQWAFASGLVGDQAAIDINSNTCEVVITHNEFFGGAYAADIGVLVTDAIGGVVANNFFREVRDAVKIDSGQVFSVTGNAGVNISGKGLSSAGAFGSMEATSNRWPDGDYPTVTRVIDFGSISAQSFLASAQGFNGARVGNAVAIGLPTTGAHASNGIIFQAYVAAANVVTVLAINPTAGAVDPGSMSFRLTLVPQN